ncbi:hypothetical protein MRB53_014539 [Persea americana]|uniref:Uncharacterized protein n=1 Tax=Persea americana TaxID=3435 RepID=A0ACC2KB55_PERAE|nr:hypothetical protein MRB53_014539 [Persea americana]|eukprot:TRINITY_DN53213_c0_g1_i1.p1 TRINITY_DN53213_c0_g1~~TRINITY_DN53213_c0_g1_i1.p1  ORF type:complete len:349 (-),score=25.45 TRINITY_DN53213_c0_g1_i1:88-1134(-)
MAVTQFFFFFLLSLPYILHSASPYPAPSQTLNVRTTHHNHPHRPPPSAFSASDKFEGSSDLVHLRYHMGPVLSSPINVYLIWYGKWAPTHQSLIRDFLLSISATPSTASPSVAEWWATVTLYTDQTGANISRSVLLAGEFSDTSYSSGRSLTRLSIQHVIAAATRRGHLPIDHRNGAYLVLTSPDVTVQDFCRAVCGFHYFTFPSVAGYTLPYAWVGNSGKQCPEVCAYPFAVPTYMGGGGPQPLTPPNGDVGVDGMISVIGHELAELASNPLVNAWYAGEDPTAPTEIADLCEGLYGSGGGGGYIGQVMSDGVGRKYNLNGRKGRRFLVQWIWSPVLKSCAGPNAID